MRAVIQRVKQAQVKVEEKISGSIGKGLLVFVGIEKGDTTQDVEYIALIEKSHKLSVTICLS